MVIDKEDLWPESFGSLDIETPLQILRKQASFVGTKTGNILEGYVSKSVDEDDFFVLILYLIAPALDNYRYQLLRVSHQVELYPVFIRHVTPQVKCNNAEEFKEYLRSKFGSEETMNIIRALIAQSKSE